MLHARGTTDIENRAHGHSADDNGGTTYTLGTPVVPALAPVLTNLIAGAGARVERFTSPPDAQNLLAKYDGPTGGLEL